MYLKSLKITNFRKFGENNNIVEFVSSKDLSSKSDFINIAQSTTLIVGKNNSGKTTVTKALDKLRNSTSEFNSNDFNYQYLSKLLGKYCTDDFSCSPSLEFEFKVGIDLNSDCDLITNLTPFIDISSIQDNDNKENYCNIILKYEIEENAIFREDFKSFYKKYNDKPNLFIKFLDLIDNNTKFKLNYYNNNGEQIERNTFKISDLINVEIINANKKINDNSLSQTFNKIIKLRSKLDSHEKLQKGVTDKIEEINDDLTKKVTESHTTSLNIALSKIESSDHLEVNLSADLTFDKILNNIIKYEYKEGDYCIPEGQFGLGYSNLMTIIANLIKYVENYPKHECHSKINLICIEEPEAFMHSQMQELFVKHINDAIFYLLSEYKIEINSQLIITTHSPHILNSKIHSGNTFNNISYITIIDNFSNVINLNDENVIGREEILNSKKNRTDQYTNYINDLKFLKKHIKFKISELFFSDAVIFVEGITEETLLSYYIDQDDELNKYYISIFNINGAHGLVYHSILRLLKIPALIITDLDIKRHDKEKDDYSQINNLKGRITTNQTIINFNPDNEKLENIKKYFEDKNIFIIFQKDAIEGFYATSLEEAFILTNYQNEVVNKVLSKIKPDIYKSIVSTEQNKTKIKEASYKLQKKISNDKSNFANELLYQIIVNEDKDITPLLPSYIYDGLTWLKDSMKKQLSKASNQ